MVEDWTVLYSRKAAKQRDQLSNRWRKILFALIVEIKKSGPVRGNWPNYSKLGSVGHNCHLNKNGSPTYVAVWEVVDRKIKIIEVTYVGTREKAPY
jgi:mRNA-degrading endonuclease RelE of RelBE toxin-antitoxin system